MPELWVAATVTAGAAYLDSRSAESSSKKDRKHDKEMIGLQGAEDRRTQAYNMELADYYTQLGKQRRRDARRSHFTSRSRTAPPADYNPQPLVGDRPEPPGATQPAATTQPQRLRSALSGRNP